MYREYNKDAENPFALDVGPQHWAESKKIGGEVKRISLQNLN